MCRHGLKKIIYQSNNRLQDSKIDWKIQYYLEEVVNVRKHYIYLIAVLFCMCLFLPACSSNKVPDKQDNEQSVDEKESIVADDGAESETNQPEELEKANNTSGTGSYSDGSVPEFSGVKLKLTVNETDEVIIAMYDNTAVDALIGRLPLTDLSFFDLSGIEKPIERLEEPLSLGEEEPGYDPITGEMVIYRPWGNFTIFYGDFRYSDELVPLGIVESGLDVIAGQTEDFAGVLELLDMDE